MFNKLFSNNKNKHEYKFSEPENTACVSCRHIAKENAKILMVSHDLDDGGWQFLCGENSHETADLMLISMGQAVGFDPTVNYLFEMPEGIIAIRKDAGSAWEFFKNQE